MLARECANVRFTPESGHSDAQERVGLEKRTSAHSHASIRLVPLSADYGQQLQVIPKRSGFALSFDVIAYKNSESPVWND